MFKDFEANLSSIFVQSKRLENNKIYSPTFNLESLGWEDPLEKEVATHASVLAWEQARNSSHGQRSLVGYSPWGHKRVRHN